MIDRESMESSPESGGFLGLELPLVDDFPQRGVPLNSGRNALEYILTALGNVRRVYLPLYICPSLLTPLQRLGIPFERYLINDSLEPDEYAPPCPREGEYVLYTNYFGMKERAVDALAARYSGRIIIDNAMALYSPPRPGVPTFYSPRKFSGLPDGGIACLNGSDTLPPPPDTSYETAGFLLHALDCGLAAAAPGAEANEQRLDRAPLRGMSPLTERLMRSIGYKAAGVRRRGNFHFLHRELGSINKLRIDPDSVGTPFCYPFRTNLAELRGYLIDHNIHLPVFWPHLVDSPPFSTEARISRDLLPLPVDQRCTLEDMRRILSLIRRFMG